MVVKEPTYKIRASNSINNGSLRRRSAVDPAVRMALAPFGRSRVNCFEKTLQGGVSQNQQKNNMIRRICQPKLFGSRPLRVRRAALGAQNGAFCAKKADALPAAVCYNKGTMNGERGYMDEIGRVSCRERV